MARQRAFRTRFAPSTLLVLHLLLLPLLATGCGSEGGGGNTPTKPDPARPTSVSLSSSAIALEAIGATHQLSATIRDQNGQTMSGTPVQWSSSDPSVATLSSNGSVKAEGVGAATISAVAGSVSGTASVSVTQVVSSVAISAPAEILHEIGATLQFTAEVRDANGHAIPGATVLWASSDPTCVEIDPASGLATTIGFGAVTISATAETASASKELAVVYLLNSESTFLSFSFLSAENPGLSEDFDGEVDGEDVVLLIPRSVDATNLAATFEVSPGAAVQVDGIEQVAGETEHDFTAVLRYTVTAEDQSQSTYTIYVGRLLEAGEVVGWQRDAGWFQYHSDPRDIKLLEDVRIHLDSTFTRIADTLHATLTDTIQLDIYPSHAAYLDKLTGLGWTVEDWYIGTAMGPDWILVESSNSPDNNLGLGSLLGLVTHEATHAIVFTFETPVPQWLHEGLASLDASLLTDCFPNCTRNWDYPKSVIEATGKPGLETMFADPSAGYAFSITTVIFIVKKYGWDALRTFLTAPTDYSVFGLADSSAFETAWHDFLDELWGWVDPGEPPLVSIAEARTIPEGLISVEGTVTWQTQWNDRIYFLQDETGGISTFHPDEPISLAEGDRIRITGVMAEYRGETQMTPITAITVLGHDTVPTPRAVTAAQINEGQFQGELVGIQGVIQELTELASGSQKVTIQDASGTDFLVYIDVRAGMVKGDWPAVGITVRVVGVLGTDNRSDVPEGTGPRVEVRRKEDVTTVSSSTSELLAFSFSQSKNPALSADAVAQIDGKDVVLLIPRSVDATSIVASFEVSPGATVHVDGIEQEAGETEHDFTAVIRYTVTAPDQSQCTYTVYLGRLLEGGESIGWQRDAGRFRYSSAPGDIKLLEEVRVHLDSVFTRIADTLHATPADTIRIDLYPSHAAYLDKMRELGNDPPDWSYASAFSSDLIMMTSPNSPDLPGSIDGLLGTVTHEGTHAILHSFGTPLTPWTHEGLTQLDLLADCFPDCELDWDWQRSVVASIGKPPLDLMFVDPAVGYGFSITTMIFIVKKYGWGALQTFLTAPTDYSVFGGADKGAFEAEWHDFLDELWGVVDRGPRSHSISEARAMPIGSAEFVSVEGTVTWQLPWDDRVYFLQDETGGISTFHLHGPISLEGGDRIRITGVIAEHRGEVHVNSIYGITVLSHDPVPTPRTVTAAEINGGQFQGELVGIQGVIQDLTELAYGNQKVTIRDASGSDFPVYGDSRTGMVKGDWPAVGTTVRVVGVLGTDKRSDVPEGTGPRVEVRRKEDVTTVSGG